MKKTNKKGFTIVELVIVIAVIAILAAVLIPNISRLVRKANVSSDLSLVKNLNTALSIESATMEYPTAYSAFKAVEDAGYDLTKIEAKASKNRILYDSVNKCFAYLNDGKLEYYPNSVKGDAKTESYQLWMVCNSAEDNDGTYSVYLNYDADKVEVKGVGFDAGDKTVSEVTYTGDTTAHNIVIRTNSGFTNVIINGKEGTGDAGDTVYHYGSAAKVDVKSVGSNSYHEFGSCSEFTLEKGHAVIESTAVVLNLKSVASGATIESKSNKIFKNEANVASVKAATKFEIASLEDLKAYRDYWNDNAQIQGLVVELTADVTLDDGWTPIGVAARPWYGEFNGNGHTIFNLNDKGYVSKDSVGTTSVAGNTGTCYGFFGIVGDKTDNTVAVNIHDVKLANVEINSGNYLAVGSLIGADIASAKSSTGSSDIQNVNFNGNITVKNVVASGTITSTNSSGVTMGGIVGKIYTGKNVTANKAVLTIENCTNNIKLTASSNAGKDNLKVGGVVGYATGNKINLINCINNGDINITSGQGYFGGIMAYTDGSKGTPFYMNGCKNTSTMTINGDVVIRECGLLVCRWKPAEGMNCSVEGAKIVATLDGNCNVSSLNGNNFYHHEPGSNTSVVKDGNVTLTTKN